MIAVCTIRRDPSYRRDGFEAGLRAAGYKLAEQGNASSRDDLLVIWNRQGVGETAAKEWEAAGGTVIVCENGYIGRDELGRQFYAIAVHGHNGSGWFPVGDEDRWSALKIDLLPWRTEGYDLICGQRGIGSKTMASPHGWETITSNRVRAMRRPFKVRRHPGRHQPATTLQADLEAAGLCLIWSSASGVMALTRGVAVSYSAPHWIAGAGGTRGLDGTVKPLRDDAARLAGLRHMAWGQRSITEIETGEPFVRIRERIGEAKW